MIQVRPVPAELLHTHTHTRQHAFGFLNPREREGLTVFSRRSMLKASLAGLAGITLPDRDRRTATVL